MRDLAQRDATSARRDELQARKRPERLIRRANDHVDILILLAECRGRLRPELAPELATDGIGREPESRNHRTIQLDANLCAPLVEGRADVEQLGARRERRRLCPRGGLERLQILRTHLDTDWRA